MIDPGHGGIDSGATSNGVEEKNLTLAIALKLRADLESLGATVTMTRDRDATVSLDKRVKLTNSLQPDIFVSIHINSSTDARADGIETFYFTPQSRPLAEALFQALVSGLQTKGRYVLHDNLQVVDRTRIPAALAEVGYLSNRQQRRCLVDAACQQRIADALSRGVVDYFARRPAPGAANRSY